MREMTSKESEPMYSREEILGMVAGPELDHLVATHVMGLGRHEGNWEDQSGKFAYSVHEFCPSTSIEAAWEVVEKINGDVTVKRYETVTGGHRYWCKISVDPESEVALGTGETAPPAICRAALLSLLKED